MPAPLQKRAKDHYGYVYTQDNQIYRGIYNKSVEAFDELWRSGLLQELEEKRLIPRTTLVQNVDKSFGLTLCHEKIFPTIYPHEWSPKMIYSAARCVLSVAKVAAKYGYTMKDCHGLNIMFDAVNPLYVDIGSFVRMPSQSCFLAQEEFYKSYLWPLWLNKRGLYHSARSAIQFASQTPLSEIIKIKHPITRLFPARITTIISKIPFISQSIAYKPGLYSTDLFSIPFLGYFIRAILKFLFIRSSASQQLSSLSRELDTYKNCFTTGSWSDYHDKISKKELRFNKILEVIEKYSHNIASITDIAGNSGRFSRLLLGKGLCEQCICIDLDAGAIDKGFLETKQNNNPLNISFVNLNIMRSLSITGVTESASNRFRSDAVICLALVHHLLLSQGFLIDDVVDVLSSYTNKYCFVEFMPKGLWTYSKGGPTPPDWYCGDAFEIAIKRRFTILDRIQTAENYVLYALKKF